MSWTNYPPASSQEDDFGYQQQYVPTTGDGIQQGFATHSTQYDYTDFTQHQPYDMRVQHPQQMQQYNQQYYPQQVAQQTQWLQPAIPEAFSFPQQGATPLAHYTGTQEYMQHPAVAGPSASTSGHLALLPYQPSPPRPVSYASEASSAGDRSLSDTAHNVSLNASEMAKWGYQNRDGTWSCLYPNCQSTSTFRRGCDLRKHYKRHSKTIFCSYEDCPASREGGFSSKKDRNRHEASHNPRVYCSEGCGKVFAREDNMRDHARRKHGVVREASRRG